MGCHNCPNSSVCVPTEFEFAKRSVLLRSRVYKGESEHSDVCKYQLHMQASVYVFKSPLGQVNANDIFKRIEFMREVVGEEESEKVFHIPDPLKYLAYSSDAYKVEWFLDGHYVPLTSYMYDDAIMSNSDIMRISRSYKIPPKLVDTLNLNDYEVGYNMWVESVRYPLVEINYTGSGLWKEDGLVCYMTVRMMSIVVSYNHIITATTVRRGKVITL